MKAASIQLAVVEGDKKATIDKAVGMIKQAKGADLMILPEIWNLGFMEFDRYVPEAEHEDGPTLTALRDMARETGAFIHTGSIVAEYDGKYYNSSYLLSPKGEILANYRKIHLFGYGSRETEILSSGSEIVVLDTDLGRLAMATCYDLRFPELFRRMMDMGAKMILVCSAWPYPRLEHWIMINRVRAIENQCFLVSCNMTGPDMGFIGAGHSMHVDPWGIILASGGDEEVIVRSEFDLSQVEEVRGRFPALADRKDWLR